MEEYMKRFLGNFNGDEIFEYKIENKNGLAVTVLQGTQQEL